MKCHNCNTEITDEKMNFCPVCRTKLLKDNPMPIDNNVPNNTPLAVTRNKAIWRNEKSEIARRIDETEFETLDHVAGLIVHDGTTAIVYVDGNRVCRLNGGVYDFVSKEEIEASLEQRVVDNSSLYGIASKLWHRLVRLVRGKKVGDSVNETSKDLKTMDQVVKNLNSNSSLSVYLKLDQSFPLLFGMDTTNEGEFVPYKVKTKYLDAEFGVSVLAQITDFELFIKYHLSSDKSYVTTYDIQKDLESYIYRILQDELRNEEIDAYGISPETRERLNLRIKSLDTVLHGIQIVNIVDITCSNNDFERFRHLAKELYCSEKELDFLKRTNEFKNRLVCVENEQRILQAKNDMEISKALDEINHDKKLHEEEERQFYILLSRQRKIREAQDEMEITKALNDIKQTDLLNKDEFAAFEQSLDFKKFDRKNVDEIMRLQSLSEAKKKELSINAEVLKCQITQDADVEAARFDSYKLRSSQAIEKMDIMEIIYGKNHESRKNRIKEEQEITSIATRFKNAQAIEDAKVANELLSVELEGQKAKDDYILKHSQEVKDFERIQRKKIEEDKLEIDAKKEKTSLEILKEKQAMSLDALARLDDMESKRKEQEHRHAIENKTLDVNKDIHLADMAHQEKMKALENESHYTAEQLFVKNLDSNSEAAEAYANSFSKAKELEAYQNAQKDIREAQERAQKEINAKNNEVVEILKYQLDRQERDKENMMRSMTDLVGTLSGSQQSRERENFDRFERVATHRMGEFEEKTKQRLEEERALKAEYREQMMHEQKRHDFHQDKALQYTTQVTEADYKNRKPQKNIEQVPEAFQTFFIDGMEGVPFQLEQLKAFVKNGMLHKQSVIRTSEDKFYAGDMAALKECFKQCDFIVCPNRGCGEKIKKDDAKKGFCPYCGNEI